ncbi:MAG TPA: DUF1653 domain-containing protein [Patescibacteria group bacterium]|nr:DUF1653 domain-containing protein [Patescibacteria group bacterium]
MDEEVPSFSILAESVRPGLYEHYKGHHYRVIGVGHHSETLEEFVVYQRIDGEEAGALWVRPVGVFLEEVEVDGDPPSSASDGLRRVKRRKRFRRIED